MRINLNIIKISLLLVSLSGESSAWWSLCELDDCKGCDEIEDDIKDAAKEIDKHHATLEKNLAELYEKKIIGGEGNLMQIDWLQNDIAKKVAHIRALEYEANIESRHIIFTLRKNKDLYTLPVGAVQ